MSSNKERINSTVDLGAVSKASKAPIDSSAEKVIRYQDNERLFGSVTPEQEKIFIMTPYAPMIADIWVKTDSGKGSEKSIINSKNSVQYVVKYAMVKADTQDQRGIDAEVYPKGKIVKVPGEKFGKLDTKAYTYEDYSKLLKYNQSIRNYNPTVLGENETELALLYPGTKGLNDLARSLDTNLSMNGEKPDNSSLYARNAFTHFNGKEKSPKGDLYTVNVDGVPVIVCTTDEDLASFKPYDTFEVPENTTSLSFIASSGSRGRGGIFENTPFIVCREGTEESIISQHITSLLAFKKANNGKNEAYPIFYQQEAISEEKIMEVTARLYALSFMVMHDKVIKWIPYALYDGAYSNRDTIKISESHLTHGIKKLLWEPKSDYNLLKLLNSFEIIFDNNKRRKGIENTVEDYLTEALELLKYSSIEKQSREFQLFVANYVSCFPYEDIRIVNGEEKQFESWGAALHRFDMWEGKEDFIESLKIPRLLSNVA